ncbi:hypothetical protein V8B55DRAFT_1502157 [Mucor lusitanicus]
MSVVDKVTEQLALIELKDDDIAEYITGIIEDESMEEDEKREVISEFLSEATDKDTENLINHLLKDWKQVHENQQKEAEEKKSKLIQDAKAREEERRIRAEKEQEENVSLRTAQKQLTKEQKEARDKLMQQYGYVADGSDDESKKEEPTELTPRDRRRGKTLPVADPLLAANRNADIVKEKEQARREELKKAADKEKERNRMLQSKQKKDKEQDKEKKKTQKGERRRM